MSSLTDFVTVSISPASAVPSVAAQNIPLVAAYVTATESAANGFTARVREYASLAAVETDFPVYSASYRALAPLFSQASACSRVMLGRLANAPDLTVEFTPVLANSRTYAVDIEGPTGVSATFSYPSDSSTTAAEVIGALVTAINAGSTGVVASDGTTVLRIKAATPGAHFTAVVNAISTQRFTVAQTQTDAGIAADLAAISQENSEWYTLHLATCGKAEIVLAAAYCLANNKLGVFSSQDSAIADSGSTTDVAYVVKATTNDRAVIVANKYSGKTFPGTALSGYVLTRDPGSVTFRSSKIVGVTPSDWSDTEKAAIQAKNAGLVYSYGGVTVVNAPFTCKGTLAHNTRDLDWFKSQLTQEVAYCEMQNDKIPMTDAGIATVEAAIRGVCARAEKAGVWASGWTVVMPLASTISPANKAAGILPGVAVTVTFTGAVLQTLINLTVVS
jgi:hypothetical protein